MTAKIVKKAAERRLIKFLFLAIGQSNPPLFSYPHMSNTLDQIPVDKTWSPTESSRKMKPEVQ